MALKPKVKKKVVPSHVKVSPVYGFDNSGMIRLTNNTPYTIFPTSIGETSCAIRAKAIPGLIRDLTKVYEEYRNGPLPEEFRKAREKLLKKGIVSKGFIKVDAEKSKVRYPSK